MILCSMWLCCLLWPLWSQMVHEASPFPSLFSSGTTPNLGDCLCAPLSFLDTPLYALLGILITSFTEPLDKTWIVHYLQLQQRYVIIIRYTSPNTTVTALPNHKPLRGKLKKRDNKLLIRPWITQSKDWDKGIKLRVRATIIRTYWETTYVMNYSTMHIISWWPRNHCIPPIKTRTAPNKTPCSDFTVE